MNRRLFLGSSAASLTLGATARAAHAQTSTPVVVAPLLGPDDASVYYAQQQGWFKQAGLDVTVQPIPVGPASMSGEVGGSLNVAEGNVLSLCVAYAKGVPFTLVAPGAIYDASVPANVELLASAASPVRSARDLNGKNVAVPSLNDLLTVSVKGYVDQSGGDSSTVHFVEMPPTTMVGALQAGRIDAAGIYEPFRTAALGQGARSLGKPYDSIAPKFLVVGWFAYRPWADPRRPAVNALAGVINRSSQYVNAHYQEMLPMIAQLSHIPEDALAKMRYAVVATSLDPALIQPVINMAAKYKVIPAAFPAKELIFS